LIYLDKPKACGYFGLKPLNHSTEWNVIFISIARLLDMFNLIDLEIITK